MAKELKFDKVIVNVHIEIVALDLKNKKNVIPDTILFQDIFTIEGIIFDPQLYIWKEILSSGSKRLYKNESIGGCMSACNSAKIGFISEKLDTSWLDYEDCNYKEFILKQDKKMYWFMPSKSALSKLEKQMKHIFTMIINRVGSEKL
jgi:hypothetical protein